MNFSILCQQKMTVKPFGETSKPYFWNKGIKLSRNLILSDKGLILKEIEVARESIIHFQCIKSYVGLFQWPDSSNFSNKPDPIKSTVKKYKNHSSIQKIKSKYIALKPFSFRLVTPKVVFDVILHQLIQSHLVETFPYRF